MVEDVVVLEVAVRLSPVAFALVLGCRDENPDWKGPAPDSAGDVTETTQTATTVLPDPDSGATTEPGTTDDGCSAPMQVCDGVCIDTREDDDNCGECDRVCESPTGRCQNGMCVGGG